MNLFRQLIAVVAAAAAMGSVQAQVPNLGTLSPTPDVVTSTSITSGTFADIFNFSIGTDFHGFLGSTVGLDTSGTPTIGTIDNLTLTLFAGSNATGPIQGSVASANGSLIDLSGALAQGDYSVKVAGLVHDATLGGAYRVSVSADPEPAGWRVMSARRRIGVFITRRKTSLAAG